jgi:hypothetical protein
MKTKRVLFVNKCLCFVVLFETGKLNILFRSVRYDLEIQIYVNDLHYLKFTFDLVVVGVLL